jgi:hypothetical protein
VVSVLSVVKALPGDRKARLNNLRGFTTEDTEEKDG